MVLRRELSLGPSGPGLGVQPRADEAEVPGWGVEVRVELPDPTLVEAIELARLATVGRPVLSIAGDVPGVARLARRLVIEQPDDPRVEKLLGVLRSRVRDGFVRDGDGRANPAATAVLARCELAQYDPRAWERIGAFASHLVALGPNPAIGAALLEILTVALADVRPGVVQVLAVLPDDWFGEDVAIHGLPVVGGGRISWSLCWDLDWPQLSWACSVPGRRITSPGLAPGWSDARPRGQVDLSPAALAATGSTPAG